MTARLALGIAAVAVLATLVYLFVEVRSAPADVTAPRTAEQARPAPRPVPSIAPAPAPPPVPAAPAPAPSGAPPANSWINRPLISVPAAAAGSASDDERANPKLDAVMDQANKAYDRQDFDEARTLAGKVLATQPNNVRMLRIMVSSACIDGDSVTAQKYYASLPKFDRDQMKTRCDRYGVSFTDSP